MRVDVFTIFPAVVDAFCSESLLGRARQAALLDLRVHDLRDGAVDRHRSVDDAPFGGGAGMVLAPDHAGPTAERSVDFHPGDVVWGLLSREGLPFDPLVWLDDTDGSLAGWSWVDRPDELFFHIHPGHRDGALLTVILDWFAADTRGGDAKVWAMTSDGPTMEALADRGYHPGDEALVFLGRTLAEGVHHHPVPDGFTVGHVAAADDVAGRVAVHRAAFAPSRVTEATFRRLMDAPLYRRDLDIVVRDTENRVVATCLCWLDEASASAELEPVSVLPELAGRGLGRAVCAAALRALREAGAETVVVYAEPGNDRAFQLYERLDFTPHDRATAFVRRAAG